MAEKFRVRQDTNPVLLGSKLTCYLCAMPPCSEDPFAKSGIILAFSKQRLLSKEEFFAGFLIERFFYLQVERKGQFFFFSNSLETKKPSVENFESWAKKQLRKVASAW